MFIKILYAASFSTFLVLPFLYKCKWRAVRYFYYRMADQYEMRNMYSKTIMLFLIWFHFLYLNLTGNHYDLLPSTIICFTMFRPLPIVLQRVPLMLYTSVRSTVATLLLLFTFSIPVITA